MTRHHRPRTHRCTHQTDAHLNRSEEDPDELLTVKEAMARLRLGRTHLYRLIRSGRLESITIGRCRRIPRTALHTLINAHPED